MVFVKQGTWDQWVPQSVHTLSISLIPSWNGSANSKSFNVCGLNYRLTEPVRKCVEFHKNLSQILYPDTFGIILSTDGGEFDTNRLTKNWT